jgi:xylulokinase
MNLAVATEQTRELFGWDIPTMEQRVEATPAGAGGILFLPYLHGERTPNLPKASGVFHGLTTENMTADCMARAVVEGVTLGLAYGLRRFRDLGVVPTEIRLTGGGSQSAVWRQIAADILGLPTVAMRVTEAAALGAAIQAAWTYGKVKGRPVSIKELVDDLVVVEKKTQVEPRKENADFHREQLLRQIDLTKKLKSGGYF